MGSPSWIARRRFRSPALSRPSSDNRPSAWPIQPGWRLVATTDVLKRNSRGRTSRPRSAAGSLDGSDPPRSASTRSRVSHIKERDGSAEGPGCRPERRAASGPRRNKQGLLKALKACPRRWDSGFVRIHPQVVHPQSRDRAKHFGRPSRPGAYAFLDPPPAAGPLLVKVSNRTPPLGQLRQASAMPRAPDRCEPAGRPYRRH